MSATNHVSGLEEFRVAWDLAKARRRTAPDNKVSEEGRINIEGDAECPAAAIYTPADAEFWNAVEPGVRSLVMFLIDELDCITYTSCEGHPPTADGYSPRRVGILPRDAADYARLMKVLVPAAEAACPSADRATVDLRIVEHMLSSEGPDLPCIVVLFVASSPDWADYMAKVSEVQARLVDRLAHLAS